MRCGSRSSLLEDGRKLKYFIRTVKFIQVALITQSKFNAQVYHIITSVEQSNVSTETAQGTSGSGVDPGRLLRLWKVVKN